MAELTRGTVFDRPWGRTLGALGLRGLSGHLNLIAFDGKSYDIAFSNGAVVAATSPIASDAAVRVALTGGLISTTQVAELARMQASQPDRDEIEVISDHLRLGFDQAMRLRRRTIAQRAARSFSVDKGDFVVTDHSKLPAVAGSELDIRAIIYLGARQNLSEVRLASELGLFGTWFRLKPEAFDDLPQFGFTDQERPIIDQLLNGASLGDLEAIVGIDVRMVRATLYALCAANACNIEQTRGQGTTKPPPAALRASDPAGLKRTGTGSQPPASQAAPSAPSAPSAVRSPAAPSTPRAHRPSSQPLVAYRPGMRRSGGSQPPPNTTNTPVDTNRPMGAAGNTMPPAGARRGATTPPVGTEMLGAHAEPVAARTGTGSSPGVRTGTSHPSLPRTLTTPSSSPPPSRPTPNPSKPPSTPPPSRTMTTPPATMTTPPATARTATPTSVPRPTSPTSIPRTTSTTSAPRPTSPTSAPRPSSATSAPRPASSTKLPGLQAPEVMALINERAVHIDRGADHYLLLGVSSTASADEIRKTYFNLARQLHPDRLAALGIADDTHVAHKVFAQLNTAFSTLSDPKRRTEYDALRGRGGEAAQREEQARAEELALRIIESEEAYKRGELALKRDDFGNAISDLQRALELNPDEPDFAALHAWAVFCATPDKSTIARQTRATLEKAIQKSPRAINPRFYLGRVHRMLGQDKEALDLFRDILLDKPSHFEAQGEIRAIEARLSSKDPKGGGGLFGKKR